jgi:DNA repair exonuclease SbcCD nuclease subunit
MCNDTVIHLKMVFQIRGEHDDLDSSSMVKPLEITGQKIALTNQFFRNVF